MLIFCGDYELRFHATCILVLLLYDEQLTTCGVGDSSCKGDDVENELVMERFILP